MRNARSAISSYVKNPPFAECPISSVFVRFPAICVLRLARFVPGMSAFVLFLSAFVRQMSASVIARPTTYPEPSADRPDCPELSESVFLRPLAYTQMERGEWDEHPACFHLEKGTQYLLFGQDTCIQVPLSLA